MNNIEENISYPGAVQWAREALKSGKYTNAQVHQMVGELNSGTAQLINGQFVKASAPVKNTINSSVPSKFGKYGKIAAGVGVVGLGSYGIYKWAKNKKAALKK